MAGDDKEAVARLSLAMPASLRSRLQDTSFLLQRSESDVACEALGTWLEAIAAKKGEKFQAGLEVLKEARQS